ncbi:hypothetical protein V6N13_138100 [Hibiscus sabdariffa]
MKSQEQARFLLGFRFLIDLNGSSFSFALPGSSLVTLSMAFVSCGWYFTFVKGFCISFPDLSSRLYSKEN